MTIQLGVIGCGSVFWTPYMSLIERLLGQGRVEVTAVYDVDPGSGARAAERLDLDARSRRTQRSAPPDVDVVLVLTACPSTGGSRARRSRRASTCSSRSRWRPRSRRPSCSRSPRRRRAARMRAAHRALADVPGDARARRAGEIGGLLTARARYGWAGPDWGRWFYEPGGGALFDLGVYNVTSLCGFFGPARRVTAMTGVAIPSAWSTASRWSRGRGQRARADRLRRRAFAVVTTGFTIQRYRSPAIELYGTHGVLQMIGDDWAPEGYELWRNDNGAWELPGVRPRWPSTAGCATWSSASDGAEPVDAAGARVPRAGDHARGAGGRRDGRARAIASDFPAPELERLGDGGPRARCTIPGARSDARGAPACRASSPRPTFEGPGADPARRRHPPRLGRPGGGRGATTDLRLERARAHARVRAPPGGAFRHSGGSERSSPPTSCSRAQGVLVIANPETARSSAPRPARACSSGATHGSTSSPSGHRRCACSSSSRRRPPRCLERVRAAQPYLSESRYADDALLGHGRRLRCRAPLRVCARPTCCGGATSACCAACSSPPASDRRDAEIGPGEAAAVHAHGGDKVLMALEGTLWVRAWSRTRARVRAGPEDVCYLPAGSRHEYRNASGATARPSAGSRRAGCHDRCVGVESARRRSRPPAWTSSAGKSSPRAAGRPRRARADAVLADCRALAASSAAARGPGSRSASCRSGRARVQRRDDRLARRRSLATFAGSSPTARGGARRGALRRRAGRGHFLYMSVGSGISHCLMAGGAPRLGVRGSAIGTGAPLVERWSSGLALARRTGHATAEEALADPPRRT